MERRRSYFDYEILHENLQQALIGFLNTELSLGPTLVKSAVLAKSQGHTDHYARAKADAIKAAETVRRFVDQIEDTDVKADIIGQLAELDRLITRI
jgi:uridine phosphorylase